MNKYEIKEIEEDTGCGCCTDISYNLFVNGENVYESSDDVDCFIGILNREGIDFNYTDYK